MATIQNLVIEQAGAFLRTIEITDANGDPYDLTNVVAITAQLRRSYSSSSGLSFTTAVVGAPTAGTISISLTAVETLTLRHGRYVYDIYLDDTRVVEGIITVTPTVTR